MHIQCRQCHARVLADDIDLPQRLAKCRQCHAVFDIRGILEAEGIELDDERRPKPIPNGPPEHMVVEECGSELTIWYRWIDWGVIPAILFCAAWDGFLVVWYAMAWGAMAQGGGMEWLALLFPIFHVTVGVAITYGTLCQLFNLTWIQVSFGTLTIRHGPVPTWGNHTLDTREIEQLYVANPEDASSDDDHRLAARLRDGTRVDLLTHDDSFFLLWLERKLEEKLKIQDKPVAGEAEW